MKKAIRIICLAALTLCFSLTACDSSLDSGYNNSYTNDNFSTHGENTRTWYPDPCAALGGSGKFYMTQTESNGVTYDYYTYEFSATYEQVAHFIVVYTEAMKDLGFKATHSSLKEANSMWYELYSKDGGVAAEINVAVTNYAAEIANGGTGSWIIVVAVPENMVYYPGNGAPGIVNGNTICVGCHGTGHCQGCGGTGLANYGDGYETCVICNGNGVCTVCDGTGSY